MSYIQENAWEKRDGQQGSYMVYLRRVHTRENLVNEVS